jgi:hypothetical protein
MTAKAMHATMHRAGARNMIGPASRARRVPKPARTATTAQTMAPMRLPVLLPDQKVLGRSAATTGPGAGRA